METVWRGCRRSTDDWNPTLDSVTTGKCSDQNLPQPDTLAAETDLQTTRTDMAGLVCKQETLSAGSALLLIRFDVMRQRLQGVEAFPDEIPIARAMLDHQTGASR